MSDQVVETPAGSEEDYYICSSCGTSPTNKLLTHPSYTCVDLLLLSYHDAVVLCIE